MEPLACQEPRVLRERVGLVESKDRGGSLGPRACLERLDLRVRKAEQGTRDCQDLRATREILEILVSWDLRAFKALQDWQASQVSREFPVCQGTQAPLGDREMWGLLVLTGRMEWTDRQDFQELLETGARQGRMVVPGFKD